MKPILSRIYSNTYLNKVFIKAAKPIEVNNKTVIYYDYKLKKHLPNALAVYITGIQGINIIKSKDIPKERKTPLFINLLFGSVFSLTGSYMLCNSIQNFKNSVIDKFEDVINFKEKKISNNLAQKIRRIYYTEKNILNIDKVNKMKGGLNAAVPIIIAALMFRFIGPVIATPVADKVNNFLIKKGYIKQ